MAAKKKPAMEMEPTTKSGMKSDMKKDVALMKGMAKGKSGASKKPIMYD